ncbi:CLUMA_CG002498, isoform A [Clunio marinus]|uniref:Flavin-containing monooxygenase n=1 Tax=Clunio marinus TaxID=568069 RepID=A0A1J1HNR2_9DIPT|nr:CLUMA_CG002498, isoform A [Clunio marinus]
MKIGVVGAGPAGLAAIRHSLEFGCEVVAFEQNESIGGTWIYTDNIETNKYGLEEHSSMYQGLMTNLPKEAMSYPDFPYPPSDKSYLTSPEVLEYFSYFANHFDLVKHIKFQSHVVRISPLLNNQFEFIVRDLQTEKNVKHVFDAVLVCAGFSVPMVPTFPDSDKFKGEIIHSHLYRSPKKYENKIILIIGGGPSGVDIAFAVSKTAKKVFWSHHMDETWGRKVKLEVPSNLSEKVDVAKFTESGAIFQDGTVEEFAVVIFATGYDYKFPFISIDCGLSCYKKYIQPLYKHCISINRPNLAIIGVPYFALAMPLFDLQIRFCLTFMTGKKQLPSREEMLKDTEKDMKERWTRLKPHKGHALGMDKHEAYYAEIARTAGIEPLKPVLGKMFNRSFTQFTSDFNNFRKEVYEVVDDENFSVS